MRKAIIDVDAVERLAEKQAGLLYELQDAMKLLWGRLSDNKQLEGADIAMLRDIKDSLDVLKKSNICLGRLAGVSGKRLAEIHGLSEGRISQILKGK